MIHMYVCNKRLQSYLEIKGVSGLEQMARKRTHILDIKVKSGGKLILWFMIGFHHGVLCYFTSYFKLLTLMSSVFCTNERSVTYIYIYTHGLL